ncbi:MAG: hypothetical protein Q8Q09_16035 [Deltaproteobacteria bacterium]|nr:hypothetical protein [Deltaproteobacteria bacterium]
MKITAQSLGFVMLTSSLVATLSPASARAQASPPQSTTDVVRSLATMPLAQLRALIAPEGLNVCTARMLDDERLVNRRRRCQLRAPAALTDAELTRLRRGWRFSRRESDTLLLWGRLSCRRTAEGELCRGVVAGPAGTHFEFRVTAGVRQLVRVTAWSLSS